LSPLGWRLVGGRDESGFFLVSGGEPNPWQDIRTEDARPPSIAIVSQQSCSIIICSPDALREQRDQVGGKMTLLRCLAALRPGPFTSTLASAKASLRTIARRWLILDAEMKQHDDQLVVLTADRVPKWLEAHGMATGTTAEMLLLGGDNPERLHSEAAIAKVRGVCPLPALRGETNRHCLNRGGNRQANAALARVVLVHRRRHQPTLAYFRRHAAESKLNPEFSAGLNASSLKSFSGISAPGKPCAL
jgi:hypothetical protein